MQSLGGNIWVSFEMLRLGAANKAHRRAPEPSGLHRCPQDLPRMVQSGSAAVRLTATANSTARNVGEEGFGLQRNALSQDFSHHLLSPTNIRAAEGRCCRTQALELQGRQTQSLIRRDLETRYRQALCNCAEPNL